MPGSSGTGCLRRSAGHDNDPCRKARRSSARRSSRRAPGQDARSCSIRDMSRENPTNHCPGQWTRPRSKASRPIASGSRREPAVLEHEVAAPSARIARSTSKSCPGDSIRSTQPSGDRVGEASPTLEVVNVRNHAGRWHPASPQGEVKKCQATTPGIAEDDEVERRARAWARRHAAIRRRRCSGGTRRHTSLVPGGRSRPRRHRGPRAPRRLRARRNGSGCRASRGRATPGLASSVRAPVSSRSPSERSSTSILERIGAWATAAAISFASWQLRRPRYRSAGKTSPPRIGLEVGDGDGPAVAVSHRARVPGARGSAGRMNRRRVPPRHRARRSR